MSYRNVKYNSCSNDSPLMTDLLWIVCSALFTCTFRILDLPDILRDFLPYIFVLALFVCSNFSCGTILQVNLN